MEDHSVMASLIKRGNRYFVRLYVDGKRREIATKTSNKKLAVQIKKQYEYQNAVGVIESKTRTSLTLLLTKFLGHLEITHPRKSFANDRSRLRVLFGQIVPELVKKRGADEQDTSILAASYAEQITPQLMNQRLDELARRVVAKTVNEYREILHRLFAFAVDYLGLIYPDRTCGNPVSKVKRRRVPDPKIRFLSLAEIEQQLRVLEDRPVLHIAVAQMIYAGLRRSEALWLTRPDIDMRNSLIRIRAKTVGDESWQPKTGTNRSVPINVDLRYILNAYQHMMTTPWVCPSPEGMRYDPDNFSHALARVNHRYGLPWTSLDFRHTFGSILAQRGVSLYKISAMMGNSPEICRKHYAALIPDSFVGDAEFRERSASQQSA